MTNKASFSKSAPVHKSLHNGLVDRSPQPPALSKPSQELLDYYKNKTARTERELDELTQMLDRVKVTCDMSHELQTELNLRNDEVARLQTALSDLQICLFQEREQNLKLNAENDKLRIEKFEDKKKIDVLLQLSGSSQHDLVHFVSNHPKAFVVPQKLPPKLHKIEECMKRKMKQHLDYPKNCPPLGDSHILLLQNQALSTQLEEQIALSREQLETVLKDRELMAEERQTEHYRLMEEVDKLTTNLKKTQDNLCEALYKLTKWQKVWDKEENNWMEEREKYEKTIRALSERSDVALPDTLGHPLSGMGLPPSRKKTCAEFDILKHQFKEKDRLATLYQEQAVGLEAVVKRMKEEGEACRITFREKTDKMSAQVTYLRRKNDEVDRRRMLEAEGFCTDIRMLRERVKELEKKLSKAKSEITAQQQEDAAEEQLLVSVKNTLATAKHLERELGNIRSKIFQLENNQVDC